MPLTIRSALLAALVAGLVAGCAFFAAQLVTTRPLIVRAEVFEQAVPHQHAEGHEAHAHSSHAWEPSEGAERTFFTLAADVLVATGFGFIVVGAVGFSGRGVSPGTGVLWGLAGFVVFVAAPALGLPPEPPGGAPGDLLARQSWWIGTALATAAGLWALVLQPRPWLRAVGVVLLIAPHLVPAPPPLEPVPAGEQAVLAAQFVWASIAANAVMWAVLGLVVGWVLPRLSIPARAGMGPGGVPVRS